MESVLVIDSDASRAQCIKEILQFIDYPTTVIATPDDWRDRVKAAETIGTTLIADIPDEQLQELLPAIRQWAPAMPVVLLCDAKARKRVPEHLASYLLGQVGLPLKYQELNGILQQAQVYRESQGQQQSGHSPELFRSLVGSSRAINGVRKMIEQVADSDATVLILGESGTGKEVVARNIHYHSPRRNKPFVPINCGAIPSDLLESELFGHEKGAFTGAISARQGRFEMAEGGTLFLDEIGDMSMHMQVKLLRVLQERTFERVGSNKTITSDVRIIAATHRNLEKAIEQGDFREDLYYRLNVFPIALPPLRERADDVPRLVHHFTQGFARRMGRRIDTIPTSVMDALVRYPWPGNVRELQNVIERAVILSKGPTLQVPLADLQSTPSPDTAKTAVASVTLTDAEREHILRALRDTNWVLGGPQGAAARLGMKRSTLHWKMKKLGISRPE